MKLKSDLDQHVAQKLRRIVYAASALALLSGVLGWIGCRWGIEVFRSLNRNWVGIDADTSIALVFLSFSLFALQVPVRRIPRRFADNFGKLCGLVPLFIGATVFAKYLNAPDKMGLSSPFALVFLGAAFLLIDREVLGRKPAQYLAFLTCALVLPSLIAYTYRLSFAKGIAPFTQMAMHSAVPLFLVAVGILCVRPNTGIVKLIFGEHSAGEMARRLFPAVIGVPLLLGLVAIYGARMQFYDQEFGLTLTVIACITIWGFVLISTTESIFKLDRSRLKAESELLKAEEEKIQFLFEQKTSERIKESEVRLRTIFDSAFEAIITNDANGVITDWNPRAEKVFGFTRSEVLGKKIYELIVPPRYREGHQRATQKFLMNGHGPLLNTTIEIEALRKNGEIFPVQISVSVNTVEGQIMFTSFIADITERKRNELELISAKQEALKAAKAKSEFLANMSHEIRTPLNGIIGIVDLLLETSLEAEQRKFAQLIQGSGGNLLTIINDILDFSKIEAGKLTFENVYFSPVELIQGHVDVLKHQARQKELEFLVTVDPKVPEYILGDPGRVGQVLLNILSNAIKFTDEGFIEIKVETDTVAGEKTKLRFSVKDSGIGLSAEARDKLFQPFVQADGSTARKYGGTGLGLSICRRLVDLMEGEIGVSSELGKGSVFWFTACFAQAMELSKQKEDPHSPNNVLNFPKIKEGHAIKVLVAEDNPVNQLLAVSQLRSLSYAVQAVSNGQEAVEAFRSQPFDLILMDCQMPEVDGYEATRLIRQLEKEMGTRIPIVALTANAMKEDQEKCLAAGMDDYISKPVKKEYLAKVLENWVLSSRQKAS